MKRLPIWGVYALLAYMPFHIFLSQWLSTWTGGLSAWKVGKDVLTMALVLLGLVLVLAKRLSNKKLFLVLSAVSVLYLILHIGLYFIRQDTTQEVGALATVYNNRVLWYLLIGLAAALIAPKEVNLGKLTRLVLVASTVVCLVGVAQYHLPKDIMTNFGYSVERGVKPAYFIDDKPDLPRIMSTLRDPNSLGAFLLLPILLLVQRLLDKARKNQRMMNAGLLLLHGLTLFLTFSRGAWAAMAVSLAALALTRYRQELASLLKKTWPWLATGLVVLLGAVYILRDQYIIQNIVYHSDESTTAELDSNELHAAFIENGVKGATEEPLGHGPGTAGIVSIQNTEGSLLTENYFVQIAYEVGILGLLLFVGILIFIQKKLITGPQSDLLIALAASFWGFILMAMVSHLWTNEAVAVYWWLLSGVAIAHSLSQKIKRA